MCSGLRSSSANGAIALRQASACSWSTSSSSVLSDWTIRGPSFTGRVYGRLRGSRPESPAPAKYAASSGARRGRTAPPGLMRRATGRRDTVASPVADSARRDVVRTARRRRRPVQVPRRRGTERDVVGALARRIRSQASVSPAPGQLLDPAAVVVRGRVVEAGGVPSRPDLAAASPRAGHSRRCCGDLARSAGWEVEARRSRPREARCRRVGQVDPRRDHERRLAADSPTTRRRYQRGASPDVQAGSPPPIPR